LTAAGTLASGLAGQALNLEDFGRLDLSDGAKTAMKNELKSSRAAAQEVFQGLRTVRRWSSQRLAREAFVIGRRSVAL
jgi:hypothetical protein